MLIEFAYLRNMLSRKRFDLEENEILLKSKKKVLESNGPFSSLIALCIKNCIDDIKNNNFDSAANELNLIHNLPIDFLEVEKWNELYFYKNEFLNYVDNVQDLLRIKDYANKIFEAQERIIQNANA